MSDSAKVPQTFSYYDKDGEWKFRKITLMGVVKSFVSQLKPGQDLTRVSLPAVLLHPYSMLEIFGIREMLAFEALLPINKENNPLERMLFVLRWLFATIQQENFHKKPYNPILGELHHCWSESNEHGKTTFMGEQVSHHPPIAAMYVNNEKEGISNTCNVSFGVRFGGNHVSIVTEGNAVLNISKFKEQYEIAKRTPDMIVKNVIFGTKKIYWSGDVSLSCPKHGYSVSLTFKESGSDNVVNGSLTQLKDDGEEEIFKIKGKCGGEIWLHSQKEKRLLIDIGAFLNKKPEIHYDSPKDIDPLDSLSVWADVNKYIVDNDMDLADEAKKKIEQDQRDRINQKKSSGVQHSPKYFQESELGWVWKKSNDNNSSKKKKSAFDSDDSDDSSSSEDTVPQVVKNKTEVSDEDREGVQLREPLKKSSNRDSARFSRSPSHSQQDKESMSDSALSAKNRLKQVSKRNSFDSKEVLEKRALTDPKPQKYLPTPNVDYSSSGEVNIIKGWMKMRNSMKLWMNRFFVLRPGKLIYFKDEKDMLRDRCVGILRLADCKVKERTSNKDGCSFKIYHLLHYPIYHKYGLRGETLKMAMIPVSWNYCILRVSTEHDRRTWMSHIIHQIEYANSMEGSVHLNKSLDAIETISPPSDDEATSDQAVSEQEAPQDVVTSQEAAEDMFKIGTPEEDQKTAVEGLALQQKVAIKALQKKTRKMLEEWKQELEVRMNSMEKRIQANINKKNTADAHNKQLVLSYWQLALILVAWFFISRLF